MIALAVILAAALVLAIAIGVRQAQRIGRQLRLIADMKNALSDQAIRHDEDIRVRDEAVTEAVEAADRLRAENTVIRWEHEQMRRDLVSMLEAAMTEEMP